MRPSTKNILRDCLQVGVNSLGSSSTVLDISSGFYLHNNYEEVRIAHVRLMQDEGKHRQSRHGACGVVGGIC